MKKLRFLVLPVLLLALFFMGCDNGSTGDGTDTWRPATNTSELNGTWKGTIPVDEDEIWSDAPFNNINVRYDGEVIFTITGGNYTSGTLILIMTFSGGNINEEWSDLEEIVKTLYPDATTNHSNHSVRLPPEPLEEFDPTEEAQINQNNTKLKFFTEDGTEVIFTKQQ